MNSTRSRHVAIGLFVFAALGLMLAGVLVFGAGTLLRRVHRMETYLDASVQGLEVGSAVKHRGVRIGKIESIGFAGSAYAPGETSPAALRARRYVRLVLAIDARAYVEVWDARMLKDAIAGGLRVRIAAQGLTGVMYVEIDYADPQRVRDLPIFWKPTYAYVPSAPSMMSELSDAAQNVFRRLEQTDIEGVAQELQLVLRAVRQAVGEAGIGALSANASNLISEVRATNRGVQQLVAGDETRQALADIAATAASLRQAAAGVARDLPPMMARADRTVAQAGDAVTRVHAVIESGDVERTLASLAHVSQTADRALLTQQQGLAEALELLRQTAQQLNDFAASIKARPSLLLRGSPAATEPFPGQP